MGSYNLHESGQSIFASIFNPRNQRTHKSSVFLSHNRSDKGKVREIASFLESRGVYYFFDEDDRDLQVADQTGNHTKVVSCIDEALLRCTHLLGFISSATRNSWWVPYEIGVARTRGRNCAYIIDDEVSQLPSYLKIAKLIPSRAELCSWVSTVQKRQTTLAKLIELSENLSTYKSSNLAFLPTNRDLKSISFL